MLQGLLSRFKKPNTTGATCTYCGWNGATADVFKANVMNEDSTTYRVDTCPRCMRNGGIVYNDAPAG